MNRAPSPRCQKVTKFANKHNEEVYREELDQMKNEYQAQNDILHNAYLEVH